MNSYKILVLIGFFIILNFELFGQINWGPDNTSYRRDIFKSGMNEASSQGWSDPNSVIPIGKELINYWDRAVYQWDISSIPDGSDILYVNLYFNYSKSSTTDELVADLFNITYDINSEDYFEEIYDQMDDPQYRMVQQYSGSNNEFNYESNDTGASFNQVIKNSLSSDKFVLGLKWFNDHYVYVTYRI
jgi:hypothetical protein